MHNHIPKSLAFAGLSLIGFMLISFNLTIAQDYPNTPVGIAQKYLDSIAENDTNKYLDSITPADRQLPGFPFLVQLVQGLLSYYGFGAMDAARISVSFVNLKFEEISNDGLLAQVRVTGSMRDLNLGMESPFSTELTLVNTDGTWLVRLYDPANNLPNVETAETFPRDAVPPQTPEQIAAATAFEQYMAEIRIQYRAAQYATMQSTSSSAVVEIKMELVDNNTGAWVEHSTTLTMRLLGGNWRTDTSNLSLVITAKGQAMLDAAAVASMQATQVAADIIGQQYAELIGGTLIYVLEDGVTIEGRRSDGSLFTVNPENIYKSIGFRQLELMPRGEGFYFFTAIGINSYDFSDGQTRVILPLSARKPALNALSISPDNTSLALSFENGVVRIIAVSDGDSFETELPRGYVASSLAWSSDSSEIYLRASKSIEVEIFRWHPEKEQEVEQFAEIEPPPLLVHDNTYRPNLAISPNNLDLFLGGSYFTLFSISDKSLFSLLDNQQTLACNPVWSSDGTAIIVTMMLGWENGNHLFKYDLTTGAWTSLMTMPRQLTDGCPVFDWIP